MLTYPNLNPIAFHIGNWPVHWYGLTYLIGFVAGWGALSLRSRYAKHPIFNQEQISDLVFFVALGVLVGGRLGYVLFYDWHIIFTKPWMIFVTWQGGMSFHGGLMGVLIAVYFYARKVKQSWLTIIDFIAPVIPLGLAAGRIGNFINGELWGRVTTMPWGMVFPHVDVLPRHPSQLYEFGLEGVLLFIILWIYSAKPKPPGAVAGLFALGYGLFRIFAECFREPDIQIGYLLGGFTEGQLLSLPLVIVGAGLLISAYSRKKSI